MTRREGGFSLLELMVVLAIFSVVALAGVQATRAVLRADTGLRAAGEDGRALALALRLLRRDLEARVDLPYTAPDGGLEPPLLIDPARGRIAVSAAGMLRGTDPPAEGAARVEWRLDRARGALERRILPLAPAEGAVQANAPGAVLLEGVTALRVQVHDGTQWRAAPAGAADASAAAGVEVVIEQARHGAIRLVVVP